MVWRGGCPEKDLVLGLLAEVWPCSVGLWQALEWCLVTILSQKKNRRKCLVPVKGVVSPRDSEESRLCAAEAVV